MDVGGRDSFRLLRPRYLDAPLDTRVEPSLRNWHSGKLGD
jgi:hypothetical protein